MPNTSEYDNGMILYKNVIFNTTFKQKVDFFKKNCYIHAIFL